jgi:biopolymer transport protein ExbD
MGGAAPVAHSGGRKALDAAINLVPFIDLLSCCISFLLITAVWSQVAIVETHNGAKDRGDTQSVERPPVSLTLYIDDSGYLLARSTGGSQAMPRREGRYDFARLAEALHAARGELFERADVAALSIRAADGVDYDQLVRTMDVALGQRFVDLSVAGSDG